MTDDYDDGEEFDGDELGDDEALSDEDDDGAAQPLGAVLPGYSLESGEQQRAQVLPACRTLQRGVLQVPRTATPGIVSGGQLFQWTADAMGARDVVLHLKLTQQGTSVSIPAGVSQAPTNVNATGYFEITYGAGSVLNTVRIDARPGAYQMPPCDYVSVQYKGAFLDSVTDTIVAYAAIAQGRLANPRPATYTHIGQAVVGGSTNYVATPANARAVDLTIIGAAITLPLTAQTVTMVPVSGVGTPISVSRDGSANYPPYSPVPLLDYRDDDTPTASYGFTAFGPAGTVTFMAIYYIAF